MDNWQTLNVLLPVEDKTVAFNLRLNPDLTVHRQMIAAFRQKSLYGEGLANFLYNALRPGDNVIDVGAHIGYYSLMASAFVGRTGFVYAFEAERKNFVQLMANLTLNKIGNVQPYEQALGAAQQAATFYVNLSGNDGAHSLVEPDTRTRQTAYRADTVELATLDSVVGDPGSLRIRAVLVSVGGAEADVTRGAATLLGRQKIDFVICQYDSRALRRAGGSEADWRTYMRGHGYECYGLMPSADLAHFPADQLIAEPDQDVTVTLVFAQPETVKRLADGH